MSLCYVGIIFNPFNLVDAKQYSVSTWWGIRCDSSWAIKMVGGVGTSWKKGPSDKGLFSQEKPEVDLTVVLRGGNREDVPDFSEMYSKRMRGDSHKLQEGKLWLDRRKKKFIMREIKRWNRCPGRLWNLCLWRFSRLNWTRPWAALSNFEICSSLSWTGWPPEVLSHSAILWFYETRGKDLRFFCLVCNCHSKDFTPSNCNC